jgi:hypothetical protein
LAECISTVERRVGGLGTFLAAVDAEVDAASPASALAGFGRALRNGLGVPVEETERDELAEAAAANDVVVVGRLLGPRNANEIMCADLPEAVVRRPRSCVLLDVAVGAGAVEVSKCLFEFHEAKPTRETLMMAISSGDVDLIRLAWARLPGEQHSRGDFMEVAADFHREEPLRWLFRDSDVFEQQLFIVFALEAHLADGLLEVLREGVRPWWQPTREAAAKYREAERLEFGDPPEGFGATGGWWEDANGVVSAILPQSNERWTRAMTKSKLGVVGEVVGVVLPSGVSSISGNAFNDYSRLRSLTIQPGCVDIEGGRMKLGDLWGVMAGCIALVKVTIPQTCASIGQYAFLGCSSLTELRIPSGVRSIGCSAFRDCSGLGQLTVPSNVTSVGHCAFSGCSGLTRVTVLVGVESIGYYAFAGCSALAQVTIPSSVASIGNSAFYGCASLRGLTIPASVSEIGGEVFWGVTALEWVTLVGCPLDAAVVAAVEPALAPGAKVVSRALAGQPFGGFTIIAGPETELSSQ